MWPLQKVPDVGLRAAVRALDFEGKPQKTCCRGEEHANLDCRRLRLLCGEKTEEQGNREAVVGMAQRRDDGRLG